jgi:O-acetyl-ADP-ribose deacetylase (regulator of RNase III)
MTDPGRMTNTQKIIHAVGPRWGEGIERAKLANTTWACLNLAEENSLKSIAFPAISVGALGYPVENCAKTMLGKIIDFTFEDLKRLRAVIIALPDDITSEVFRKEFELQLEQLRETGEGRVRA